MQCLTISHLIHCTVNKLICVQENITSIGTLRTSLKLIFIAPNQLSNSITKIGSVANFSRHTPQFHL